MRIAICEDEDKYADQLIGYIYEWAKEKNILVEIFSHITAERFLYEWEDSEDYDMIFLDIQMGKMTGMELAKIIRRTNNDVAIVFATNKKEYVLKGYSVAAMQYLLKPVRKEDCFVCLNQVYKSNKVKKYYLLNDLEKIFKLPHEDIIYIEMFSHNATMKTTKQEYTFRKTITKILEELNDDLFIRCHKSYIINLRHIEAVFKTDAEMSDGSKIPLSKNIVKEINERFIKYNFSKVKKED
jgi:DNA-binding LytR/AlgR family response regulator